jgi:hypothetical protein
MMGRNFLGFAGTVLFFLAPMWAVADEFRDGVEADWVLQETGRGRAVSAEASIEAAWERGSALLADLSAMQDGPDLSAEAAAFQRLGNRVQGASDLSAEARGALYHELRWAVRAMALKNPLFASRPIVFMERKRFICQMLHEYMAYFYDYGDISGGGVYRLESPGYSSEVKDLIGDRLPKGNYTTLSLSYEADTLYFAFGERATEKPDFYSKDRRCFHLYSMTPDGEGLRQLTEGMYDDFDPAPLPDGGLAFMSTRRGGFTRCNNAWEPLEVYTLHRMNPDGTDIQRLSHHETNEWHPSVLNDGSIVYTRWDYVDRSAAHFHGLWSSNPDGTNPRVLFGNYTQRVNAFFQPRAVPNSNKIAFIAGAHHANVGGSLVLLDPSKTALDGESGEDLLDSLEVLTPDICFPEAPGWPDHYFHSPWPLSENYFLAAYSHDALPGMGPKVEEDTETGIYLFDRFGNLELLHRKPGISAMYPVPLAARAKPPILASTRDAGLGDEGVFMLSDVRRSHFEMPDERPVKALRVFQLFPKSETHEANVPRIGHANAEGVRMLLGTVPVEADGSAHFRAPARTPLAFQAVDAAGRAVQGMRSVTYLQPGERRSCVGCHEPIGNTPKVSEPAAMKREPSEIEAGPDGSKPWSFNRLIQPILDARCIRCHDGGEASPVPDLKPTLTETFTVAYESLRPYVRWYEWGDDSIQFIVSKPGDMPSDKSRLPGILADANHGDIGLSDAEMRSIYLWLDGNAAFYGGYGSGTILAQQKGAAVGIPWME